MVYKPFKIVIIYLLSALAWIIITDQIMKFAGSSMSPDQILFWQSVKGITFVLFTAVVLYVLVRRNHESLAISERQYRELFASNPNPMWVYSVESYRFIEVNQAAIDKYGYSKDEFLSMTVLDIRPPEDRPKVIAFIERIKTRQETSGEWRHTKKNGEELFASIKSFPVNFNGQKCAMVLAVDATERIQQQQQLEDSYRKEIELNEALATHIDLIKQSNEERRRMGEVIEKINNFVIIIEADGKVRWANKAFLQFSQSAIQEVVGQEAATLFFRDDDENKETLSEFLEVFSKQGFYSAEILNRTKTGLNYWAQTDASPIYGEDGSLDCYIVVQTLITERKLREEKIRQQNRTLRQLAWVSSHELRKPVSSIISLVNLLREMDEGEERQDCLRLLGECSSELDNLVKDIAKKVNVAEGEQPLV